MSPLEAILAFTAAAALLTITPGLDTALVLRTAAVEGPRRAMLAGAGICLGCLVWGAAASAGLGALLAVSSAGYDALRLVGAGYLGYLGITLLLRRPAPPEPASLGRTSGGWFLRGLLTNLLNPKVGVFYLTFLPQFVPAGTPVTAFSLLLAAIHATQGLLWFGALTTATQAFSSWLMRPRIVTVLDRATGLLLLAFGVRLVLDRGR